MIFQNIFLCAVYKLTSAFEKLMYTEAGKTAATKDVDQVNNWRIYLVNNWSLIKV